MKRKWSVRKYKKNIIILAVSTLISFLVIVLLYEVYENIRYRRFKAFYQEKGDLYGNLTIASDQKGLVWEYRPNGISTSKQREHMGNLVGTIKTNRYGFRDNDYESPVKERGVFRVAFLGDSVTLGLYVDYKDIFVRRFEVEANKLGLNQRVQALNFSVDSYDTTQVLELLKIKALDFLPDKVVYMMSLNDFDSYEAAGKKILYFRKPKSFFLHKIKVLTQGMRRSEKEDYYFFYLNRTRDIVFSHILKMNDILSDREIDFLVVIIPVFSLEKRGFSDHKYTEIHEEIVNVLAKENIRVFDLLEVFKAQGVLQKEYAIDVWHPNEVGHRIIAEALLGPVLQE